MAYQCSATTVQNTHLEIPTDVHALEALAELSFSISCQLHHWPVHQILLSIQPLFREKYLKFLSPQSRTQHFCCHCATLHGRHCPQCAPPAPQLLLLCWFGKRRVSPWLLLTEGQTSFPLLLALIPPRLSSTQGEPYQ